MKISFLSILAFCTLSMQGQTFNYNPNKLLFQDSKTKQAVVIIDDSLCFKGKDLLQQTYKHTPYLGKMQHYLPFYINGKTFLSHSGCGCVLEYRNDSIVRIDNSFLHMSQIGASTFQYKNEIYYFGGYGLFTFKNILTKYNFKTHEWDKIITTGKEKPSPRANAYSQLIGDKLYVFSGHEEKEEQTENTSNELNSPPFVWVLNLKTLEWKRLGTYNEKLNFGINFNLFTAHGKLYSIVNDVDSYLFEIDIKNNQVKKYETMTFISLSSLYYDEATDEVVFFNDQQTSNKSSLLRIKLSQLKGKLHKDEAFIHSIIPAWFYILPLLLFIGLLVFRFRKRILSKIIPFNGMVYKKSKNQFYYNGKLFFFFPNESILLEFLYFNMHQFTPLISLNKIFENGNDESFTAVTKRRELAYTSLVSKLTVLFDISEQELILHQKNTQDKRIKEIKLSSAYFKIK